MRIGAYSLSADATTLDSGTPSVVATASAASHTSSSAGGVLMIRLFATGAPSYAVGM